MTALTEQLFCYAQDLHELLKEQSALQQRNQLILKALVRGKTDGNLLFNTSGTAIGFPDVTDVQDITHTSSNTIYDVSVAYLSTDINCTIIQVNDSAEQLLGEARRDLCGTPLLHLMPSSQRLQIGQLQVQLANSQVNSTPFRCHIDLFDGCHFDSISRFDALIVPQQTDDHFQFFWLLEPGTSN